MTRTIRLQRWSTFFLNHLPALQQSDLPWVACLARAAATRSRKQRWIVLRTKISRLTLFKKTQDTAQHFLGRKMFSIFVLASSWMTKAVWDVASMIHNPTLVKLWHFERQEALKLNWWRMKPKIVKMKSISSLVETGWWFTNMSNFKDSRHLSFGCFWLFFFPSFFSPTNPKW